MAYTIPIIAIPAGKCPAKLESTQYEDVIEWAEKVYSIGLKNNVNYLPSAVTFFAQQFFSVFSEDYKTVCNHINSAYNNNGSENVKFDEMLIKINEEKKIAEKEKLEKREREEEKERKKKKEKEAIAQAKVVEKKVEPIAEPQQKKKITIRRK